MKILVVEDQKMAQRMIKMVIENLGYLFDIVETGSDAITHFKTGEYGLILMDLGLPDTDGREVTKTIRKLEADTQTHIPIVALTAHFGEEYEEETASAGMDGFITKPISVDQAKSIFEKYLSPSNS